MFATPVRLGQQVIANQPVSRPLAPVSAPGFSSFVTAPQQAVNAEIATIQEAVVTKLRDENFRNMLIAGAVGFAAGFVTKWIFTGSCAPEPRSIEE